MPSLNVLAGEHTALDADDVDWLHLLLADWQLLADLSFADLVLWVPTREGTAHVALAQMRPTTGPTVHHADLVGAIVPWGRRGQLDTALREGHICRERDPEWRDEVPFREETIPVVRAGRVIGVISRHTNLAAARTPSRLELTYLRSADDLAQMIAEGRFPVAGASDRLDASPRVGDGLIRLDPDGVVTYASPNALSAYRRLGLAGDLLAARLGELTATLAPVEGPVHESLAGLLSGRVARGVEVDALGTVLQLRTIPLLPAGKRTGALVLVRDVSELRLRERELVSKDATIREIHHRVKNNLQTVAALLRLQARRLPAGQGRQALTEAVRRVGAIAVVHETLSRGDAEGLGDALDGDEVVARLLSAVAEVAHEAAPEVTQGGRSRGAPMMRRTGHVGRLDAEVATPLALVLAELIQNALEHGFAATDEASGTACGQQLLTVHAERISGGQEPGESPEEGLGRGRLRLAVTDNGRGLPPGFDLERSTSLGLQIVRTLVTSELRGELRLTSGGDGGVEAVVEVPLHGPHR